MYDSISADALPSGEGFCYAGYCDGEWPDLDAIRARFPDADILSVAVFPADDADCLDIETEDATPADAVAWYGRQQARGISRPCLYADASTMAAVLAAIQAAGIGRAAVRLWSAHYGAGEHICGPSSCGATSIGMDATQWTDQALGLDLDQSLLLPDFFGTAPAPVPDPVPAWQEAALNALPVLQSGAEDKPGQVEFVHRMQALVKVIGAINAIPGASGLVTDGVFGPATSAGLGAVQRFFRITQDSVCGPVTWSALITGSVPIQSLQSSPRKGGPSMLAALETKIRLVWHDLTGEARAELEKALADAKADEAQLKPLIDAFRTDLEGVMAQAEPGLKKAAEDLLVKLAADAAALLG